MLYELRRLEKEESKVFVDCVTNYAGGKRGRSRRIIADYHILV